MKRAAILGTLAVLVSLLLTGCVSQSTYKKAVQESNALNGELARAQTEKLGEATLWTNVQSRFLPRK